MIPLQYAQNTRTGIVMFYYVFLSTIMVNLNFKRE